MEIVLYLLLAWVAVSIPVGLFVGRICRLSDREGSYESTSAGRLDELAERFASGKLKHHVPRATFDPHGIANANDATAASRAAFLSFSPR